MAKSVLLVMGMALLVGGLISGGGPAGLVGIPLLVVAMMWRGKGDTKRFSLPGCVPPAPMEMDQGPCSVVLMDAGPHYIQVIKMIRGMMPGMGLKEGKDLVDHAPAAVVRGVSRDYAERLEGALAALGALVVVRDATAANTYSPPPLSPARPDVIQPPAQPVVAPPPPKPVAVKSGLVDLVLVSAGPNPTKVRQALKKRMGLDLLEAYEAVEKTPHVLEAGAQRVEASCLKTALEAEGAELEIRDSL